MPFIEVDVESGENSDMSLVRMFDATEDPREITWVVALRRDGTEGPCAVTGWSADGPCAVRAAPVWDSGDGVALLVVSRCFGTCHVCVARSNAKRSPSGRPSQRSSKLMTTRSVSGWA